MIDDKHFSELGNIILKTLEHKPESLESYDDNTFNIAIRFLPDMVKSMGAKNLISLGWRFLPEFWMAITGGVPKLVIVAEFTGDSENEIHEMEQRAEIDLKPFGIKTILHVVKAA